VTAKPKRPFDSKRPKRNKNRTIAKNAQQTIKDFIDCARCTDNGATCREFSEPGFDSSRLRGRKRRCQPAPFFIFYAPGIPHPSFNTAGFCPDYPRDKAQCATEPYKTHSVYCRDGEFPEGLPCPLFKSAVGQRILANLQRSNSSGHKRLSRLSDYLDFANVLDRTVDELIVFLKQRNLRDDTLILYVTDNGARLEGSKGHFSEHGYRTPIIVNYPGLPSENCTSSGDLPGCRTEFAHATDLVTTILAAAGCAPTGCGRSGLPGQNLRDPATLDRSCGPSAGPSFLQCLFGQQGGQQNLGDKFPGRYVLAEIEEAAGGKTRLCKYYKDCDTGRPELYDLTDDPGEACDLIKEPGRCGRLVCSAQRTRLDDILSGWEPACGLRTR
jgi:arylsulfatase A-like enzyme